MLGDMTLDANQTYTYWRYSPDLYEGHEFNVVRKLCDKLVGNGSFDFNTSTFDIEQQSLHANWTSLCEIIKENDTLGIRDRGHFCNANGSDKGAMEVLTL